MADVVNPEINTFDPDSFAMADTAANEYATRATDAMPFQLFKWGENWKEGYNNAMSMLYNASEAEKERAWSKMMSDTQYQRAAADLEAAGINPLYMLLGSGSPAGSFSGSAASAQSSYSRNSGSLGKAFMLLLLTFARLASGDSSAGTQVFGKDGDLIRTIKKM